MVNFNKEELLKIARLSALKLDESEIELFEKQLQVVLSYTSELEQVSIKEFSTTSQNVNVFRDDKVVEQDSVEILAQAPKVEDNFFVVPKIL